MSRSQQTDARDRLGTLFVEVTGRSTVTETQHSDGGRRAIDPDEERLAQLRSNEDGLDDAVGMPDDRENGY